MGKTSVVLIREDEVVLRQQKLIVGSYQTADNHVSAAQAVAKYES